MLSFRADAFFRVALWPGVPSGLFQYPRVFFPDGENPGDLLVAHCTGVPGYDNAMLCYEPAALGSAR